MKRDSQTTMEGIINEWKESGLVIKDFAQKKKITKTKLQYWMKTYSGKGSKSATSCFFRNKSWSAPHQNHQRKFA